MEIRRERGLGLFVSKDQRIPLSSVPQFVSSTKHFRAKRMECWSSSVSVLFWSPIASKGFFFIISRRPPPRSPQPPFSTPPPTVSGYTFTDTDSPNIHRDQRTPTSHHVLFFRLGSITNAHTKQHHPPFLPSVCRIGLHWRLLGVWACDSVASWTCVNTSVTCLFLAPFGLRNS